MCFKSLNILLQLKFYNKNFNKYKPLPRLKPFILTQIFTKKTHRANKSHDRKHEGSEKTENWKRWWQRQRRHQNKTSTTSYRTFSFGKIVSRIFILHNTVPNPTPIQELHIRWHKNYLPLHVDTWIHATFRHGMKEFDLSINTHPIQPLEFPWSSQASWLWTF